MSEIENRLQKLEKLKEKGINPYVEKYSKENDLSEVKEENLGQKVKTAGRLMSHRSMGKIAFANLLDFTGRAQIVLQLDKVGRDNFRIFEKLIDIGDFIGVEGEIFKTQKGEISILVENFELLTKALLPMPEKYHGLKDEEVRFRKRYLDLIFNPQAKELFLRKEKFWRTVRDFLIENKFHEVETPILENTTGGAEAEPFKTHMKALDIDLYLRISAGELWQKKLMVGGFEKTFEIGRVFRNEGISPEHLQDYSQMECYWAYANYKQMMALVKEMYQKIVKEVYGKTVFEIKGFKIDFLGEWPEIDYTQEVLKQTGLDIRLANEKEIKDKLAELKIKYEKEHNRARLIDSLWKYCRKKIAGPAFLVNHPVEISPLAKADPENPNIVQRFQVIIAGSENGNGYSELNNPLDQEDRFIQQQKMIEAGDKEAMMYDKEFVTALKYGMPPTAGFGFSERLFSFLEDRPARECVLFPVLRPEQ